MARTTLFQTLESIGIVNDKDFKVKLTDLCNTVIEKFKRFSRFDKYTYDVSVIRDSEGKLAVSNTQKENTSDAYITAAEDYKQSLENLTILLSDRFNFKLNIASTESWDSYISILTPSPIQNILVNGLKDGSFSKNNENKIIGVIDLKNAKLGGIVSNLPVYLIFNPTLLFSYGNLDGGMFGAVLMHEVGHLFTNLEYSARLVVSNNILSELAMDKDLAKDPNKIRLGLISSIEALDGMNEKLNTDTLPVLTYKFYRTVLKTSRYTMYTNNLKLEAENISDLFASRMGFGMELIKALDAVGKFSKPDLLEYNNVLLKINQSLVYGNLLLSRSILSMFVAAIFGMITGSIFVLIGAFVFLLIMNFILYLSNDRNIDAKGNHPSILERSIYIKKEAIRQLKVLSKTIPQSQINEMLEQISEMDALIDEAKNRSLITNSEIVKKLTELLDTNDSNWFTKYDKLDNTQIEKILEGFSNNDLFVKSFQLKQLGE